jgi:hypothetical protein
MNGKPKKPATDDCGRVFSVSAGAGQSLLSGNATVTSGERGTIVAVNPQLYPLSGWNRFLK